MANQVRERTPGTTASRELPKGLRALAAHPFAIVAAVAFVVRLALALVLFLVQTYTIGDEMQYVEVAATVARGKPAESWFPDFGQRLYDGTWTYTGIVRFLFDIVTPSRFVAQLVAVAAGVAVAVLTVVVARRFVSTAFAALAGLVVALLPSQVLWSSVALRESMVWLTLVGLAALVAVAVGASDRRTVLACCLGVAGLLFALGHLREQTLIAACWAIAVAAWFGGRTRAWRGLGLLAVTLVVPAYLGLGVGGVGYVTDSVNNLSTKRAYLSLGAESSVTDLDPVSGPTTTVAGEDRVPWTTTTLPVAGDPNAHIISGSNGERYKVEETTSAHLGHLPRGLSAFLIRPFPWDPLSSHGSKLALLENLLWFALYAAAAVGLWHSRRSAFTAFPVVLAGAVIGIASISQANVGTAFRHRGQLLWVVAVFAAVAAERWYERRPTRDEAAIG